MQRRLPVVCSRVSSMPEVAGDSAEYFDPSDSAEIAAAMMRVLGDSELRSRMAERGVQRAKDFSWSSAASGTLAVYRRLL
jgi:glycosyltransferase involved in cell wall biosynthesis